MDHTSTVTPVSTPPALFAVAADTGGGERDDCVPRLLADSGTPHTSGRVLFTTTADDSVEVGVGACTTGGRAITDRADTETVRILSGSARLTDAAGTRVDRGRGGRPGPAERLVRPLEHPGAGRQALRPVALSTRV